MDNQITPEQRKEIDKIVLKFFLKSMWNGAQHGLMALLMNFVLYALVTIFLQGNTIVGMIGAVAIALFVLKRIISNLVADFNDLDKSARLILKK